MHCHVSNPRPHGHRPRRECASLRQDARSAGTQALASAFSCSRGWNRSSTFSTRTRSMRPVMRGMSTWRRATSSSPTAGRLCLCRCPTCCAGCSGHAPSPLCRGRCFRSVGCWRSAGWGGGGGGLRFPNGESWGFSAACRALSLMLHFWVSALVFSVDLQGVLFSFLGRVLLDLG